MLPCPQDLRYAIFAVGASQDTSEIIRRELPDLRKSCIVRVLGPLRFELGLPNSITAVISFHECYPEVTLVLKSSAALIILLQFQMYMLIAFYWCSVRQRLIFRLCI